MRGEGSGRYFLLEARNTWEQKAGPVSEDKTLSEATPALRGIELILLVTLLRTYSIFIKWRLLNFSSACSKLKMWQHGYRRFIGMESFCMGFWSIHF